MKRSIFIVLILALSAAFIIYAFYICINKNTVKTNNDVITIVIDPGHGGQDGGKTGNVKNESVINLEIAMLLKELLVENGFNVIMTRDTDDGLYPQGATSWDKPADMNERKNIIINSNASMVISIHQNSYTDSRVRGAQVFYSDCIEENETIAKLIQQQIIKIGEQNDRILLIDNDLKILKDNPMPSALVECGFLSNQYDEQLLLSKDYQLKVATAIYTGICEFFDIDP